MDDIALMREALREAHAAYDRGECAVGAVMVRDGGIIARAGNRENELHDPTAHAEILVLREAGRVLGRHAFPDCTVYTTLWPCPMCANAMLHARVRHVVCGARSFKYIHDVGFDPAYLRETGPILERECRDIYIRWVKRAGLDVLLEYEGVPERPHR
ncbi:MAG TPA: nucleoside deaminase [Usitatibacter sp.]|nr:nucleoside deaminase [Usitatibacter sp.]